MALFTQKDRLAITVIVILILTGWSIRLFFLEGEKNKISNSVRVIRSAVQLPEKIANPDSSIGSKENYSSEEVEIPAMVVNINTAELEEIETLPMIGEVKAKALVEYRLRNGYFSKPEDIMKVKGIGPATFEKLKPYISVGSSSDGK